MGLGSFLAVGLGAGAGAWVRWWLGLMLNPVFPAIPVGTLAANLIGGYLMGVALGLMAIYSDLPPELRLLITTGFLGGLTTFSAFSGESVTLISRQQYLFAGMHLLSHVLGSLLMTGLGLYSVSVIRH